MKYLRVSLLKACNFNCFYCLPPSFQRVRKGELTPVDQFKKAIGSLVALGIRKVRFTGGEPTLYKGLAELISFTKSLDSGIAVAVTTNGMRLAEQVDALVEAGLDSLNISLDTVNPHKFHLVTESDTFDSVVEGIATATRAIPEVKINTVAIRGVNDGEFADLVAFADRHGVDIRFIEYMPTRYGEREKRFISSAEIRASLPFELMPDAPTPEGAARYYTSTEHAIRIGFISSVSQPFCGTCDRLRLTADGKLYTCLFSNRSLDFFAMLDQSDTAIGRTLASFMKGKEFIAEKTGLLNLPYEPSFTEIGG